MAAVEKSVRFKIRFDGDSLTIMYIKDQELASKYTRMLQESPANCLGADIETGKKTLYLKDKQAGLCPYRSFISLVQFYDETTRTIYLFDTYYINVRQLAPIFRSKRVIFHNALFDVQHLMHNSIYGVRADCSMIIYNMWRIANYVDMDEEEDGEDINIELITKKDRRGASLRACAAKVLGIRIEKELQTSNWTDRPLSKDQLIYGGLDSYLTHGIGKALTPKLVADGMSKVYSLNRKVIRPVCSMILNGCEIDVKAHSKNIRRWEKERDEAMIAVRETFGKTNLRSPKQVDRWLNKNVDKKVLANWERSKKTELFRANAETLLLHGHLSFVKPLLAYKKIDKLCSTYGQSLLDKICPVTGRLHPQYTLGYTATGRMSGRKPNIQHCSRDPNFRKIFIAPEGRTFVGADYGQIEMRIAGMIARDKTILSAFDMGQDLHSLIASKVLRTPLASITDEQRKIGKIINFALLYGMGSPGLIRYAKMNFNIVLTPQQSKAYVKTFRESYYGYTAWQKRQRDVCGKLMRVSSKVGKRRKLGENFIYTCSVNHPVQSDAASVMLNALNRVYAKTKNTDTKMILCVHDELLLECPKGEVDKATVILKDCMEKAMHDVFPEATLNKLIDAASGGSWHDAH